MRPAVEKGVLLLSLSRPIGTFYGGGQTYATSLIEALARAGEAPVVVSPSGGGNRGACVRHSLAGAEVTEHVLDSEAGGAVMALRAVLDEVEPCVVHAHGLKTVLAGACRRKGIPCLVTIHHGGLCCPAGARLNHRDEICTIAANERDCLPCVLKHVPGWRLWRVMLRCLPRRLRLWLGRVTSRLPKMLILTPVMTADLSIQHFLARFRDLAREAKLFVAPSPAAAEALMANGVPASGIRVVRHGIPLMKRRPLPLETASGPLRFIYVGRINHVKGVHVLIEAMRMFGTAERHELHVYGAATTRGEKRYESRLKRRSALLPVKWHGSIPPSEIEEALGMADVMVHPTICLEIFGLTIAEAHSVGRPVIATRCGGAEFQIRDGIDGRLVPPNDARALHRAMTEVVSLPQLPIQWASQIQAPHSIHEHVEELMDLYSKSAGGFHVD